MASAAAAQDSYPATVSLVVSWDSIMNWSPNTAARSSSNMNTGAFYPRALFSCVMFSCQSLLRTVIITFMKFLAGHPNIAKSKLPSSCPLSLHAIFATPKNFVCKCCLNWSDIYLYWNWYNPSSDIDNVLDNPINDDWVHSQFSLMSQDLKNRLTPQSFNDDADADT